MKEKLNVKEKIIREQALELDRVNREFEHYRMNFSAEDIKKLEHELFQARHRMEELEKQNKEAVKCERSLVNIVIKHLNTFSCYSKWTACQKII